MPVLYMLCCQTARYGDAGGGCSRQGGRLHATRMGASLEKTLLGKDHNVAVVPTHSYCFRFALLFIVRLYGPFENHFNSVIVRNIHLLIAL